jgi:hypothetical protein
MHRTEVPRSLSWTCTVPVLCALHCAAAPLLVGLLPALAVSDTMEWLLLWGSLVIAALVAVVGLRVHREWRIPGVLGVGFGVWGLSLAGVFEPLPEVASTVVGSLTVAAALFWNARRSARARRQACGCPGCDDAAAVPEPRRAPRPVLREENASARSG